MSIEIELKAHVKDREALKSLLFQKAAFLWAFEKEDTYWQQGSIRGKNGPTIRLRREKLCLPDGSEKSSCLVTYKTKEIRDGLELNDEKEFEVGSKTGQAEPVFEDFLLSLGFERGISKRKQGWAFSHEGINAELCEVKNLGWLIELEIMLESGTDLREAAYAESRERLLNFLDSLEIERSAIESRFYSELLKGLNDSKKMLRL